MVCTAAFAGVERYVASVAPRLAAAGMDVHVVGGDGERMRASIGGASWSPGASMPAAAAQLAQLGRFDVVHAHMTAAEAAAVLTRPRHRGRLVATLHFGARRGSGPLAPLTRQLGRAFDLQLAISEFVARATGATRVLHPGVESVDLPPGPRRRSVVVLQRLEREKQTGLALEAWSRSELQAQGWVLTVAGRGSEEGELRRTAERLGIDPTVEWLGFVDDPGPLLASAGMLLATTPVEAFGLSVVEAMARATPVVAADGGAHPETVGPGGWLFRPGDPEACAAALDRAARADLQAYGSDLRARQRALFDIDGHVDRYRQLLG